VGWHDSVDADDDQQSERRFTNRELIARMLPYVAAYRAEVIRAGILVLATIALGLVAPLVLGQIIDIAILSEGEAAPERVLSFPVPPDRNGIMMLAIGFIVLVVGGFFLEASLGFLAARVGVSVVVRLKEDLFRHVMTLDPGFYREYPPGRLIARVESDTESLRMLFSNTTLQVFRAALTFAGIAGMMALFDIKLTLLIAPMLLVIMVLTVFFVRFIRKLFKRSRRYLAAMTSRITEYLQGIQIVQHFEYGETARQDVRALNLKRYTADRNAGYLNYSFWGLFGMFEVLAVALVLAVGVGQYRTGVMTLGTLVIFIEYIRLVFMPVQHLSEFVSQIQQGFVAGGRIFGILATPPANPDREGAKRAAVFAREVAFNDVRFSYGGRDEALKGVSFTITRGKRVALVGPSGGG
jgi:ABC-type multidrug transport system fused ATPase/permease subunit